MPILLEQEIAYPFLAQAPSAVKITTPEENGGHFYCRGIGNMVNICLYYFSTS
jgi:hypothetical protein